jgi:tRNA pseudouridine38-40 synthase
VRNIKATIEYDGTDFCGFQIQPSDRTVQGELERAGGMIFPGRRFKILGAGRTDSGVHATGQVISFGVPEAFPVDRLCGALNGVLSGDVRVKRILEVPDSFHPRYSAKSRTYVYVVLNRVQGSALLRRYTWHVRKPLSIEAIRSAAAEFIGIRDFASFGMPHKSGGCTVREIQDIKIRSRGDAILFHIRGNAFLKGMARTIAGTLVEAGRGELDPRDIAKIMGMRDRRKIRVTAPPQGLFLTRVEY